jgi:hypothetical protein
MLPFNNADVLIFMPHSLQLINFLRRAISLMIALPLECFGYDSSLERDHFFVTYAICIFIIYRHCTAVELFVVV